jgi:hypothetical protein
VELLSIVGVGLFMLASVVVGARLLRLWRITRQLPELLLGVALWCTGFLGFALEMVARLTPGLPSSVRYGTMFVGLAGEYAGAVALILFAWRVFRPRAGWAMGLAGALAATLVLALAGEALSGQYLRYMDRELIEGPFVPFGIAVRGLAPAWMALESFRYHGMLRRRVRLGLAEPVVVHRLALWGTATAASAVAHGVAVAHRLRFGSALDAHAWALSTTSALAVVAATGIALAFFPPPFYRRWVRARVARPA